MRPFTVQAALERLPVLPAPTQADRTRRERLMNEASAALKPPLTASLYQSAAVLMKIDRLCAAGSDASLSWQAAGPTTGLHFIEPGQVEYQKLAKDAEAFHRGLLADSPAYRLLVKTALLNEPVFISVHAGEIQKAGGWCSADTTGTCIMLQPRCSQEPTVESMFTMMIFEMGNAANAAQFKLIHDSVQAGEFDRAAQGSVAPTASGTDDLAHRTRRLLARHPGDVAAVDYAIAVEEVEFDTYNLRRQVLQELHTSKRLERHLPGIAAWGPPSAAPEHAEHIYGQMLAGHSGEYLGQYDRLRGITVDAQEAELHSHHLTSSDTHASADAAVRNVLAAPESGERLQRAALRLSVRVALQQQHWEDQAREYASGNTEIPIQVTTAGIGNAERHAVQNALELSRDAGEQAEARMRAIIAHDYPLLTLPPSGPAAPRPETPPGSAAARSAPIP